MKNGIITKFINWINRLLKKHLPDEKIQTGEQVTAVLKNKNGDKKCIRTN